MINNLLLFGLPPLILSNFSSRTHGISKRGSHAARHMGSFSMKQASFTSIEQKWKGSTEKYIEDLAPPRMRCKQQAEML